jgi:two-component system, OmpR family, alkaline phosphatase synthesis response regulator PhoP
MTKRILLCDDEVHILKAAEIKFRRAGFDVRSAADGEEAWQVMLEWTPDVLVTDCQMPRLNGLQLCARCREHEFTKTLPIVMLTAKGYEISQADLTATYGVIAVMAKPFSPRELVHHVEQILETGTCVVRAGCV